jgi:hypothetical protein
MAPLDPPPQQMASGGPGRVAGCHFVPEVKGGASHRLGRAFDGQRSFRPAVGAGRSGHPLPRRGQFACAARERDGGAVPGGVAGPFHAGAVAAHFPPWLQSRVTAVCLGVPGASGKLGVGGRVTSAGRAARLVRVADRGRVPRGSSGRRGRGLGGGGGGRSDHASFGDRSDCARSRGPEAASGR